ncbi:MAG: hypothetical protein RJA76_1551 [Bacteroidota bacterium]|jgi:hypothetical protein
MLFLRNWIRFVTLRKNSDLETLRATRVKKTIPKEINFNILFAPASEISLGEKSRSYKVDKNNKEFYFFSKCPEQVLDVDVYKIPNGELHLVEVQFGSPKRFVFLKEKDDSFLCSHSFAMSFNEGFVYVSKSCRFVLG